MNDTEILDQQAQKKEQETEKQRLDRWLIRGEFALIIIVMAFTFLLISYESVWGMWKHPDQLQQILNWKLGVLLLIPLFYRTIRTLLERIRAIKWTELDKLESETQQLLPEQKLQAEKLEAKTNPKQIR